MSASANGYTLAELSRLLGIEFRGDPELRLTGLATLKSAGDGDLSFLSNSRYTPQLIHCRASAVIVDTGSAEVAPCACLITDDPYLTYARASQLFRRDPDMAEDQSVVHSSAVIDDTAELAPDVTVGPNSVIGPGVRLEQGVVVGPNCTIGARTRIGGGSRLYATVTLYHDVSVGHRAIIHSGAVIGADGFGYAPDACQSVKIAQLGGVRIGDDVEIGAGTTVDRGALDDTVIGDGVKIDNLVQIAHNCIVGDGTIICGCTGLAGSAEVGRRCVIGGGVGISGHLKIADDVTVGGMSFVSGSISRPGVYSSGTLLQETREWRRNALRLKHLDSLNRRVRELEGRLEQLEHGGDK